MKRLDKLLADAGLGSRSALRALIRAGRVTVDGTAASGPEQRVCDGAVVLVDGAAVAAGPVYLLMYKPLGVVSSTRDPRDPTVLDILEPPWKGRALFPVGRLDKNTQGLLLLTDDGDLAHRLTSPRYAVEKTYLAVTETPTDQTDAAAFAAGLTLKDGTVCRPALLEPKPDGSCLVTLREGKYHQVRRMLAARGKPVTALTRLREGSLTLEGLCAGQVRPLTAAEAAELQTAATKT